MEADTDAVVRNCDLITRFANVCNFIFVLVQFHSMAAVSNWGGISADMGYGLEVQTKHINT